MPNTDCICRKRLNPSIQLIARQAPTPRKNKCCNICMPDAVANRIPVNNCNYCPPLKPGCNGPPASFTPVQNVCLLGNHNRSQ